jgi:DNA polymerase III epsilon subunit-like protein
MYLFFDCETGGLEQHYSLLTLAAVVTDKHFNPLFGGNDDDTLYLEIRHPTYIVTPDAMTINKIDLVTHSARGLKLPDAQTKFETWLNNAHKRSRVYKLTAAGHNVPFDLKFVWEQLMLKDVWEKYCGHHTLDTVTLAGFFNSVGLISCRCNLGALCAHLGIPHQNAHNAMADTLATIEVARRFYALMQPAVQAAALPAGS